MKSVKKKRNGGRRRGDGLKEKIWGGKRGQQRDKYVHEGVFLLQISSSCNLIL